MFQEKHPNVFLKCGKGKDFPYEKRGLSAPYFLSFYVLAKLFFDCDYFDFDQAVFRQCLYGYSRTGRESAFEL